MSDGTKPRPIEFKPTVKDGMITYADIYKGLWKCRDFELSHVWQRSIFLTAFLLACYAGYGSLIVQCATTEKSCLPFWMINGMAFGIGVIGLLLSLLWIMMAKGSKAWYEIYENAIGNVVERYEKKEGVFEGDAAKDAGFRIPWRDDFKKQEYSDWLWNSLGGRYSVSKINIAIGQLSAAVWSVLIILHIILAKHNVNSKSDLEFMRAFVANSPSLMAAVVLVLLLFWVYVRLAVKSSTIE
ncbi:MAG: hypothetical protein J6Z49_10075 [Kiritimatiellae bacterium]|nr:hypothetical protein [Kiritimatiellia bacterium]